MAGHTLLWLNEEVNAELLANSLVMNRSWFMPFGSGNRAEAGPNGPVYSYDDTHAVWVGSAGNTPTISHCFPDNYDGSVAVRDLWNTAHPYWDNCPGPGGGSPGHIRKYNNTLDVLRTGKAIMATGVGVLNRGVPTPSLPTVSCGDIAEYCFVVPEMTTSDAAAVLSSVMYYLMQMYETPEGAIHALKSCTKDIGEPGVDREYGQGLVDLRCPEAMLPVIERR